MHCLECEGIVSIINDGPDDFKRTNIVRHKTDQRFYKIPYDLAIQLMQQEVNAIPILVNHNRKYTIGKLRYFCIKSYKINDQDTQVLCACFIIDNVNFIEALKRSTILKYKDVDCTIVSKDGFIPDVKKYIEIDRNEKRGQEKEISAELALMSKFAGLSLHHDNLNKEHVVEISICVAGAREVAVIRSVKYVERKNQDTINNNEYRVNENQVNKFVQLFSSLFSSSVSLTDKINRDLDSLNADKTCLYYYQPSKNTNKMNHVRRLKYENKINEQKDPVKDLFDAYEYYKNMYLMKTSDTIPNKGRKRAFDDDIEYNKHDYDDDHDITIENNPYISSPHKRMKRDKTLDNESMDVDNIENHNHHLSMTQMQTQLNQQQVENMGLQQKILNFQNNKLYQQLARLKNFNGTAVKQAAQVPQKTMASTEESTSTQGEDSMMNMAKLQQQMNQQTMQLQQIATLQQQQANIDNLSRVNQPQEQIHTKSLNASAAERTAVLPVPTNQEAYSESNNKHNLSIVGNEDVQRSGGIINPNNLYSQNIIPSIENCNENVNIDPKNIMFETLSNF